MEACSMQLGLNLWFDCGAKQDRVIRAKNLWREAGALGHSTAQFKGRLVSYSFV
jgi:hypothetical protein